MEARVCAREQVVGLSGNIIFLFVEVVRIEKAITDSNA
jgi:hypothetical protein